MTNSCSIVRLGTRASALARWQAEWVAELLQSQGVRVELVHITTQGDVKSSPIGAFGGRGVFTTEIQRALVSREIDIAVHSLKDLPTEPVSELVLGAVPQRASVADALISRQGEELTDLPEGAVVGTGSARRQAQLLHLRPDLQMREIRGNVDTRLRKLEEGQYDAILLAEAGLGRLGLADRITQVLSPTQVLPAVGQGALGIECRAEDEATRQLLQPLNDPATREAVLAERAMLAALRGGCLAPVGGWARMNEDGLRLDGVVLDRQGRQRLEASAGGGEALALGERVAQALLEQGADRLLERHAE